jgi:hypothetical protein
MKTAFKDAKIKPYRSIGLYPTIKNEVKKEKQAVRKNCLLPFLSYNCIYFRNKP